MRWNDSISFNFRCAIVSMVEHSAVNRGVVGSSPTRGAWEGSQILVSAFFLCINVKPRKGHNGSYDGCKSRHEIHCAPSEA